MQHLRHIFFVSIVLGSCLNSARNDSKIEKSQDSLQNCKLLLDSLSNTDAILFDKALRLEKDSASNAIAIYHKIVDGHVDKTIAPYSKAPYYAKQAHDRIHYLESLRFLEFIKSENVENIDVTTYYRDFKIANIDSFMLFISKRRFEIYDADEIGNENTKITYNELRKQLMVRKGHAFDVITQLSYIYSMPYPQYSQTDFAVSTDEMTGIYITLSGNYRLSFQFDGNNMPYKLAKIESYHIADL